MWNAKAYFLAYFQHVYAMEQHIYAARGNHTFCFPSRGKKFDDLY